METMRVFVENNTWKYELNVTDASSTMNLKGVVTDTAELPPPTSGGLPDLEEFIDSLAGPKVAYTGANWAHSTGTGWYNDTFSFNLTANSLITITWTGYKVQWFTEKFSHHGIVGVQVDSEPEQMVDLYIAPGQDARQVKVFEKIFPSNGSHTLKLRCTGTKNSASSNHFIIHDFVKAFTKQ
jgi:hypothetical protein